MDAATLSYIVAGHSRERRGSIGYWQVSNGTRCLGVNESARAWGLRPIPSGILAAAGRAALNDLRGWPLRRSKPSSKVRRLDLERVPELPLLQ